MYMLEQNLYSHTDTLRYECGVCKDGGATHRSGTVPPLWTFGRRVERMAGRALILCPPGNTAASSVKIILSLGY